MTAVQKQEAPEKARAITRLANLLGGDVSLVLADYMSAVDDVPLADLRAGIDLAKKACPYFPRPAELRHQCDVARRNRQPLAPKPVLAASDGLVVSQYACTRCEDQGWEFVTAKPHAGPTVRRCICFPSNPVLAAQRVPSYSKREERKASW